MLPALPTGIASASGRLAELLDDLERGRLLALDPVGVDRVDELDRVLARRARGRSAAHRRSCPRSAITRAPCISAWASLPIAILPSGHDHRAAHARPGRVGGGARRGVAGRGADHGLGAGALGARDGDGHAPVLEAAGRVGALELEQTRAPTRSEITRRLDQRRRALVEGDHRVVGLERQPVAVALDQTRRHRLTTNSSSITRIARGAARRKSSSAISSSAA